MEVKPGYKQTEVGVIPKEWEVYPLVDCSKRITDGEHITPKRSTSGYYLLSARNIHNGHVDLSDVDYVGEDEYRRIRQRCNPETGDILISCSGTVGRVAIVPNGLECVMVRSAALVKPDPAKLNGEFAQYFLQSTAGQKQILNSLNQGAQANLFLNHIQGLRVPLPPTKAEQEAIAEALSDADALNESLEQLLVKKRSLKQGAMQELLTGRKRLPGFSGKWEVKPLGGIAHIKTGSRNNQDKIEDGDYPFFVRSATVERINSYSHDGEAILVPGEGGIGNIFHYINGRFDVHQRVYAITQFSPDVSGKYVYLYMTVKFGVYAMQNSVKATVDSLRLPTFQNFEVALPPTAKEQTAIAATLSDMDAEIAALETKLDKALLIKQGMMQELLTGRIRLVRPVSNVTPFPSKKKSTATPAKPHNWQINEAVIIAVLAKHFGSEQWPLARKRCTKLTYLLHRHVEHYAEGYLKKAAGPYNPDTRYKGPEAIAQKNGYVSMRHNGSYEGFVAADNIAEAESYFEKWYGPDVLVWLELFRFKKTDELELLTTVDFTVEELYRDGKAIKLDTVKKVIQDHPEWKAKLDREVFCDNNINRAIQSCKELFAD